MEKGMNFIKIKSQNDDLRYKTMITLFFIVCYWLYFNICFGYFLSKIFYNFFNDINKTSLSKSIKFRKKFKSLLKFRHNFQLLKELLSIFWETFLIFSSLVNEILFLNHIINWAVQWTNLIRLLMSEYVLITGMVYLILLGIFGIFLGFLLGLRKRDDDIYIYSFYCFY
jgi:hypothetical protein